ncbi:MAG: selenium cofactor biosynthesis protein YqeC [Thermoanaerobacteraceae bacterium]|nr:selenium cofactor biosynthesis protein YqeC [Thermoanaerobacteraceae bacterium]
MRRGSGSKTTVLFKLGRELFDSKKVLLTTTTKIYVPEQEDIFVLIKPEADIVNNPEILTGREKLKVWGGGIYNQLGNNDKLLGVGCNTLDYLFQQDIMAYLLIEVDGARQKPIKAPAEYEPCIPKRATTVLDVIGMDAIGNTLNEKTFHRVDVFLKYTDFQPNSTIDTDVVAALINWEQGLFKNVSLNARKLLILNKVDNPQRRNSAEEIVRKVLMQKTGGVPDKIIFLSFWTANHLVNGFKEHNGIVIPTYGGQSGHPPVFLTEYRAEFMDITGDAGARSIIKITLKILRSWKLMTLELFRIIIILMKFLVQNNCYKQREG